MHNAMTWIQQCSQIVLKQNLMIRDYNHLNGMGYGLQVVEKDIQSQTEIMSVPINSCLIPQTLNFQYVKSLILAQQKDSKLIEQHKNIQLLHNIIVNTATQCCKGFRNHPDYEYHKKKLESILFLTVQVLTYNKKQSSSQEMIVYSMQKLKKQAKIMNSMSLFANYSNSWPKQDMTNLIYWGANVILKIRSKYLIQFRAQLLMQANQIYKQFIRCFKQEMKLQQLQQQKLNKEDLGIFQFDEFNWAMNTVRSRHIPQCQFNNISSSKQSSPLIIAPLIDYINHPPMGEESNVKIEISSKDNNQYVNLISTKKIKRGEQLYINYGDACSSYFLNKYGFVNQNNKVHFNKNTQRIAKFQSLHEFEPILREQKELKLAVLSNYSKFGIRVHGNFVFRLNSDYQDELKYLRLILMSAQDLYAQKISNQDVLDGKIDFSRMLTPQQLNQKNKIQLSFEHQFRVIKIFQSTLMEFYRVFSNPSRIEKQDWRKVQTVQSASLNYALSFEQQEIKILQNAKKFLKNVLMK